MEVYKNPGYLEHGDIQKLAQITAKIGSRATQLLDLKPGDCVLDVGCGPGIDTTAMAPIVSRSGTVFGIDYDEAIIREANINAVDAGVSEWTKHQVANALCLPFNLNTFDASRSERLFQHIVDGSRVFGEILRVTKPGGRIAVADTDWATVSIDTPEIDIERRIARYRADMYHNGYAGRQLYGLFQAAQMSVVAIEAFPIIWTDYQEFRATSFALNDFERRVVEGAAVSSQELQKFTRSLEAAQGAGRFCAMGLMVLVVGVKRLPR